MIFLAALFCKNCHLDLRLAIGGAGPVVPPSQMPPIEVQAQICQSKGVPPQVIMECKGKGKLGDLFQQIIAKHKGKGSNGAAPAVLPPPGGKSGSPPLAPQVAVVDTAAQAAQQQGDKDRALEYLRVRSF